MARKPKLFFVNKQQLSNSSKYKQFKCYIILLAVFILLLIMAIGLKEIVNMVFPDKFLLVKEITKCKNLDLHREIRGEDHEQFLIHYNAVPASKAFKCHQSITWTTQMNYSNLGEIVDLVDRWQGPISVAVYAPHFMFPQTIDSLSYLRNCENIWIRELVTFHIYYDKKQIPKILEDTTYTIEQMVDQYNNCFDIIPSYENLLEIFLLNNETANNDITNVGRNIAIETVQTHFILPSEIGLLPSMDIIPKFLRMIEANPQYELTPTQHIYALPIFRKTTNDFLPRTKEELVELFNSTPREMFYYENDKCDKCDKIPYAEKWLEADVNNNLTVFRTVKRIGDLKKWRPFYIGAAKDPFFDKRVSSHGEYDKAIEAYYFCVMDYDIRILNDAFLIRTYGPNNGDKELNSREILEDIVLPEMRDSYGSKDGCEFY